jgi:hypothetical protein
MDTGSELPGRDGREFPLKRPAELTKTFSEKGLPPLRYPGIS